MPAGEATSSRAVRRTPPDECRQLDESTRKRHSIQEHIGYQDVTTDGPRPRHSAPRDVENTLTTTMTQRTSGNTRAARRPRMWADKTAASATTATTWPHDPHHTTVARENPRYPDTHLWQHDCGWRRRSSTHDATTGEPAATTTTRATATTRSSAAELGRPTTRTTGRTSAGHLARSVMDCIGIGSRSTKVITPLTAACPMLCEFRSKDAWTGHKHVTTDTWNADERALRTPPKPIGWALLDHKLLKMTHADA